LEEGERCFVNGKTPLQGLKRWGFSVWGDRTFSNFQGKRNHFLKILVRQGKMGKKHLINN